MKINGVKCRKSRTRIQHNISNIFNSRKILLGPATLVHTNATLQQRLCFRYFTVTIKVGADLQIIVESHKVCLARNKAKNFRLNSGGRVKRPCRQTRRRQQQPITEITVTFNSAAN